MEWSVRSLLDANLPQSNSHEIRFVGDFRKSEFEQWILLTADRHWDNPQSDWELQARHLELARERNAPVIDVGDFFCLMQGKGDPRRSKSKIRPEHNTDTYLDSVTDHAAEWFAPYASQFAILGYGNHETKIIKHQETDLLRRFADKLNQHEGARVHVGGYGGWVKLSFDDGAGHKMSMWLKYFHGSGGGGPVTLGTIQSQRRQAYYPDADVVVSGHIHDSWLIVRPREVVSRDGVTSHRNQLHISIPTYKDEFDDGHMGFHVEGGRPPKPIGCVWLKVRFRQQTRSKAGARYRQQGVFATAEIDV